MTKQTFTIGSGKSSRLASKLPGPVKSRLVISDPVGPVKSSRGPDLSRSDTFVIVDAIQDCGPETGKPTRSTPMAIARRLSATFRRDNALTPNSSAANSNLSTPKSTDAKPKTRKMPLSYLMQKARIPSSLSMSFSRRQNIAPTPDENQNTPRPQQGKSPSPAKFINLSSRLPKSQTTQSLNDWRRPAAPASTASSGRGRLAYLQRINGSHIHVDTDSSASASDSPIGSQFQLSQSSMSSLELRKMTPSPKTHYSQVSTPQPSKYWTGRFVSVHDRLSVEKLANCQAATPRTNFNAKSRPGDFNIQKAARADDEIERYQRAFEYLDSLCVSDEARGSLKKWQEEYANKNNQPKLHPERAASGGLVSRFFISGPSGPSTAKARKTIADRRNRDFLDDIYYGNTSNAFGLTSAYGVHSRYLSFR